MIDYKWLFLLPVFFYLGFGFGWLIFSFFGASLEDILDGRLEKEE